MSTVSAPADYVSVSEMLVFSTDPVECVEIEIISDGLLEFSEDFFLSLSGNDPGVVIDTCCATVTILDTDGELCCSTHQSVCACVHVCVCVHNNNIICIMMFICTCSSIQLFTLDLSKLLSILKKEKLSLYVLNSSMEHWRET